MSKQIHPAVMVAIIVVLVAVLCGAIWYYSSPHTPAGVHYTPGVPPWMEKGAKGGYSPYKIPAGAPAPANQSLPAAPGR